MAEGFDLRKIVRESERDILGRSQASGVGDPGSIGRVREELLRNVIRDRLPRTLALAHSAEIVTRFERSGQCDLVIYDADVPPLISYDAHSMLAAEAVRGVIEVKSTLSTSELDRAYDQLYEARAMSDQGVHGPAAGWVIAFNTNAKLSVLRDRLQARHETHDGRKWLDGVWILGQGAIVWGMDDERPLERPRGGARLRVMRSHDTLFMMLWLISERFRDLAPNAIDLMRYMWPDVEEMLWTFDED
jgi:hypothetical protein